MGTAPWYVASTGLLLRTVPRWEGFCSWGKSQWPSIPRCCGMLQSRGEHLEVNTLSYGFFYIHWYLISWALVGRMYLKHYKKVSLTVVVLQAGSPSGHSCLWPCCSCSGWADLYFWWFWLPSPLPLIYVALPSLPWLFSQITHERGSRTCRPYNVSFRKVVGSSWRATASLDRLWRSALVWAVWPYSGLLVLVSHSASSSSITRRNCTWW